MAYDNLQKAEAYGKIIEAFVFECCIDRRKPFDWLTCVRSALLLQAFNEFLARREQGEARLSPVMFGRILRRLGFIPSRSNVSFWHGICLKSSP